MVSLNNDYNVTVSNILTYEEARELSKQQQKNLTQNQNRFFDTRSGAEVFFTNNPPNKKPIKQNFLKNYFTKQKWKTQI